MADAQKTIDLIFNGVDKTGAATLSALNNAKSFTTSLQNVTQPIADFTVGALKVEAGLLAAGVAMTVFAVKTAGDFDGAFRQISTIVDASEGDLAGFKTAILDYAQGSTQPLDQITQALANAIGSGVDWSQSLGLIATAEKLAVATRSDLDSTTKVLVSTLNSYGMEMKDAGALSDLFFKIIDEGDISMADLAASFAKVAPIAKISGVSLQEVGAAIATLTASGIKPAESIEYLRGAINNIINPSAQAKDLAAELGLNFGAAGLKADGLGGLLQKVAVATGGSAEKMKILFGDIGGFTAAATLAGPQADKFAAAIVAMGQVTGATDEAFGKMAGSLGVASGKISSAFNVLLVNIGTPLLDEFGGIANAIAGIFTALGESVKGGALGDLAKYIESQFGSIQSALETVAKNLPAALASADFSGFKGGIDAVLGALKSMFGAIDITSVEGLKTAIELAGTAFLGLSKYTAGVIEAFEPLFNALVDVGKGAKEVDLSFLEFAGNIGGIATQLNIVLPLFTGLLGILTVKSGLTLLTEFKGLVSILPGLATSLTGAGVALATYFAADKVIDLVKALNQWQEANGHLQKSQEQGEAITKRAGITLDEFAKTTGIAVASIDEAMKLVDAGTVVWSTAANGWVKAGDALADVADAAQATVNPFDAANQAMLGAFGASEKAAGGAGRLAGAQKEVNTYALQTVPIYDKITGAITGYEQQLVKSATGTVTLAKESDKAGGSLAKIADETKKAEEAQRKWGEELTKMAHAEKLKLIEAQSKITTAQIEADAKVSVAAFDSISSSISESYKLLGDLFGLMTGYDKLSYSTQNKIDSQIDLENQNIADQFKLQKELTEATIAKMKAQTDALLKGDGLIKIDGAGLKPHLEAFMWEILRAIQVKVNADGLKMLLGA